MNKSARSTDLAHYADSRRAAELIAARSGNLSAPGAAALPARLETTHVKVLVSGEAVAAVGRNWFGKTKAKNSGGRDIVGP